MEMRYVLLFPSGLNAKAARPAAEHSSRQSGWCWPGPLPLMHNPCRTPGTVEILLGEVGRWELGSSSAPPLSALRSPSPRSSLETSHLLGTRESRDLDPASSHQRFTTFCILLLKCLSVYAHHLRTRFLFGIQLLTIIFLSLQPTTRHSRWFARAGIVYRHCCWQTCPYRRPTRAKYRAPQQACFGLFHH